MTERRGPVPRSRVAFIILAIAATVAAVGQVTLGGVVRATGSGLGCPDWPLCHGRIIPPLDAAALIEYSHRVSASVLGLLVLALAALAWTTYRKDRWISVPAIAAVGLVFVAAGLGALTVWTELDWWLRLLHLAIAESLVACLVLAMVAGWSARGVRPAVEVDTAKLDGLDLLLMTTLAGVFVLLLFGSYMVGVGYGSACGTWPLCRGSLLPLEEPYLVHMLHRFLAAIVGVLVVATALSAWRRGGSRPALRWAAAALVGVFLVQILVGAATVWAGFSALFKSIHLAMATVVWVTLAFMAALNFAPRRLQFRGVRSSAQPVSGLEGATP